jgi:hypothetical protein
VREESGFQLESKGQLFFYLLKQCGLAKREVEPCFSKGRSQNNTAGSGETPSLTAAQSGDNWDKSRLYSRNMATAMTSPPITFYEGSIDT